MRILVLDFDGVLHSYSSGWRGATSIPDPPVPGAMEFLSLAVERFNVHVFSSRSNQEGGIHAMSVWIQRELRHHFEYHHIADSVFRNLSFPTEKPAAFVTIDDRAITFTGEWPSIDSLLAFKPWNKRDGPKA
ncbi:MAG: hypothetical protein WCD38_11605 [Candidatus Tumulicola sp.]